MDDYESGQKFCDRVKAEVQELDLLVNNAGMMDLTYRTSRNGHERTLQGNNLACSPSS